MHHVLGYDLLFSPGLRLKIEAYYQYLYHIPIIDDPNSTYSRINSLFGIPDSALVSKGKGYNKGVELTLEKFYSNNYYFLLTGSLFDSKYKAGDGKTYNTYFNTGYQANVLAGKDFKVGNTRQNIFSLNFKTLTRGGFRYTSMAAEPFAQQMPYHLRFDLGIKYRKNNSRYSWILSLDVQNVASRKNVIEYEIGVTPNHERVLRPQEGLGIVPVLNLKVEF
jgi:outer membrane receptor protein involved in Fe transport